MQEKERGFNLSWFFKWFLDNKAITVFLVSLLLFLNIYLLTKISFLFIPILNFLQVLALPLIMSGLIFYLLNPLVNFLESRKIPRLWAIVLVFVLILALLVWGVAVLIPNLRNQFLAFVHNFPAYLDQAEVVVNELISQPMFEAARPQFMELNNEISNRLTEFVSQYSPRAVDWASNFLSSVSQFFVAILIMPFIVFYLLRDGKELNLYLSTFMPTRFRPTFSRIMADVNKQLGNYVQGQITVAFIVAIMFIIFFKLIGLNYAVTLGVTAGFLNLIPYLGSFLAMIPALILGLIAGPTMLIKVILVFIIEQTIEGRFVSPLILGSQLNIHPLTILFVLLTSGSMFGVWGVFLGVPVYASLKVIVEAFFTWYQEVSGLYEEENHES
ncbi:MULTISPECIES: AI-2E family transporter [unclassified Streptococcus]|uniref:AI-2E family transporter n=1 Tax=unclassified Streptococcus TaxID=2608887 RepID=UPI001071DD51|nr:MULTISPECIES: AI-2E family transporter [unclassified Streptococcus]MBF0805391.1 AI-2E family transporter [Streptococcus sp. 19428wA2_WM07]TFU29106.1 AI-2E family transporter [Streptococcus sp. WM07]